MERPCPADRRLRAAHARRRQQEQWEALPGQSWSCLALLCHQYPRHCYAQGAAVTTHGHQGAWPAVRAPPAEGPPTLVCTAHHFLADCFRRHVIGGALQEHEGPSNELKLGLSLCRPLGMSPRKAGPRSGFPPSPEARAAPSPPPAQLPGACGAGSELHLTPHQGCPREPPVFPPICIPPSL